MTVNDVELLFQNTIKNLKNDSCLDDIDFLGLNFDEGGKLEIKLYYPPSTRREPLEHKNQIEAFIDNNGMHRLTCETYSLSGKRRYIVLKNKNKETMQQLLFEIKKLNPWFMKYESEVALISRMDNKKNALILNEFQMPEKNCLDFHMIGFKHFQSGEQAINIEWLTRKISSEEMYAENYLYDDKYYLSFLLSMNDESIQRLCYDSKQYFLKEIECDELHLWLFASDYYENGKSKRKLYFKCTEKTNEKEILTKLYRWLCAEVSSNQTFKICRDISQFINKHEQLSLYGFALGACGERKTVNLYLIKD